MAQNAFDFPTLRRSCGQFRRLLTGNPLLSSVGLLVLVTLVFLAAPRLDIAVSGYFHGLSGGFSSNRIGIVVFLREAGTWVVWAVALGFAVPLAVKLLAPESRLLVRPRASLFALGSLAIGPGLIVNALLKQHWGRPRPREIVDFGGDLVFTPVWWISDQCRTNCSFVSGEAAAAFWLVVLVFVAPKPWRRTVAAATLLLAAGVSLARLAVGGHFISDVLIAWLLTLIVILALDALVLKGMPSAFDDAVDGALTRGGRALRAWWAARARPGSRQEAG